MGSENVEERTDEVGTAGPDGGTADQPDTETGAEPVRARPDDDRELVGADTPPVDWWHRDHPTFTALTGFFTGLFCVTAVPGGFAGVLRLMFTYPTAERYFPWVALVLVLPLVLVALPRTRRFGWYMLLGMLLTALVVLGVASLVLWFLVRTEG